MAEINRYYKVRTLYRSFVMRMPHDLSSKMPHFEDYTRRSVSPEEADKRFRMLEGPYGETLLRVWAIKRFRGQDLK